MSQIVAATAEQFSRQIPLIECMYPGYRVKHWNIEQNHSVPRLFLELEPVGLPVCPRCRQPCLHIHDQKTRRVRDYSSLWGFDIFVEFPVRRVRCRCGCHRTERLSWVEPRARLTNQMISHLQYRLRSGETHKDLAESLHLSWDTIRVYDELMLKKVLRDPDFSRVENIAIDEFSIRKGHRYATIVIDVDVCKVLWVGMGKTINSVRPFFDLLRKAGADKRIRSVSCDMNAAYPRMVRENLPQAVITYDLFHVISNFTRDVLKEAKKAAQETLRAEIDRIEDDEEKESLSRQLRDLKSSDWLMVRRKEDLKAHRLETLDRVTKENALFAALQPVAERLRKIWSIRSSFESRQNLLWLINYLRGVAAGHDFRPARRFAGMLRRRLPGIIHAGRFGFGTSRLEGVNNRIKVIKRKAYGIRNFRYFVLKIRETFPGKGTSLWIGYPPGIAFLKTRVWSAYEQLNTYFPTKP